MKPPFPSLTPTWHNEVYAAIDYRSPNVSHKGHTVVITGASGGIGRQTAIAFAIAGAKHLVLVGLDETKLDETRRQVVEANTSTQTSAYAVDVTNEAALTKVASEVGTWDAFVYAAGWMVTPTPLAKSDIDDYWKSYEVNVKGIAVAAKVFLPTASSEYAAFIALVSSGCIFPASMLVGFAGYQVAKLAAAKTLEILAVENPGVFFAAVHPGMVETDGFRKSGYTSEMVPVDNVNLSAGFNLWLTLPHARFLSGRLVWANWDVDELKAQESAIVAGSKLTFGYDGWPFPSA